MVGGKIAKQKTTAQFVGVSGICVLYASSSGAGALITKLHLVPLTPKSAHVPLSATQSCYNLARKLTEHSVFIYLQNCGAAAVIPLGVCNVTLKDYTLKFLPQLPKNSPLETT